MAIAHWQHASMTTLNFTATYSPVCVCVCVCLELYKRCFVVDSFLSVAAAARHGTVHDRISYEFHQLLSYNFTHDFDKMHIQIIVLCE